MPPTYLYTLVMVSVVAADFYNPKYDEFDIQPLLENDRMLLGYTKCFLEQGPCTPEAKDFRKVIPEALETSCAKCSPKQRQLIKKVIRAMMERHPEAWEELFDKYDGEKKYRETFKKFVDSDDK